MYTRALLVLALSAITSTSTFGALPIVDGPDSIADSSTLTLVREQNFDTIDISNLALLDSAAPVDQVAPDPLVWGDVDATGVQSVLIRVDGMRYAGQVSFSAGVEILGVVTDVKGTSGFLVGAAQHLDPANSQVVRAETTFGVGMDYAGQLYRGYEVSADTEFNSDSFSVDRAANTVDFDSLGYYGPDDLRILITYGDVYGDSEYMDINLTEGDGLIVGAEQWGSGQSFSGIPLTPEPGSLLLLSLTIIAARGSRNR